MTNQPNQHQASERKGTASRRGLTRDAMVAAICGFVVVLMVGAAYAAVPFYNWFCRATGFNGTTQVATSAPKAAPLARKIAVRFDSNVAGGLPWKFEPEQTEIEVKIGEVVTVGPETFAEPPETLPVALRALVRGAHRLPDRLLLVLDVDQAAAA